MVNKPPKEKLIILIATVLYAGYLPLAPGTWGSLAGVLIYLLIRGNFILHLTVVIALFLLGLLVCGKAEKILGKKDDKRIVIDETFAVLLLFLFIPKKPLFLVGGFIIYRLFDILKPFPAKELERIPRSWGIMADDIAAVIYSYICVYILLAAERVFGYIGNFS